MPQDVQSTIKDPEFLKLSPDDQVAVLKHLDSLDPQRGAAAATAIRAHTAKDTLKEAALAGASYLPAIGGAAGGIISTATSGPEAAPIGAGLGGAAGKFAQQGVESAVFGPRTPPPPIADRLKEAGLSAIEQATLEAGGQVLGKAGKALASSPSAERWAARPVSRMLRQQLPETATDTSFPGLVLSREPGLPILTGKYGMKNAVAKRVTELVGNLDATAAAQAQQGRTVNLQNAVGSTIQKLQRVPQEYEMDKFVSSLADLEKRITSKRVPNSFVDTGSRAAPLRESRGLAQMTPTDALEYRRNLLEMINHSSGPTKDGLTKVYTAVTREIHAASPEMAALDNRIHNLIYAREAMEARVSHLESGMVERTAGKGLADRVLAKLPTRSVPWERASSKIRRGVIKAGGTTTGQAALKQAPRAFDVATNPPPSVPDEDENE